MRPRGPQKASRLDEPGQTGEMLKRQQYIILVLVVLLVAVLFKLPSQTVEKVKLAVGGLFLPLFGLAASTHELEGVARTALVSKRQLARENDQLRRQNQQLQIQLQQDAEILRQDGRLRALLGWSKESRANLRAARVVARDPENWWRTIQINLGSRDGLHPNYSVLSPEGFLIGRVQSVGGTRSEVILLGDPNLRVSVIVQTNGETGVVFSGPSSPRQNDMVDLGYLSGTSSVRPGQSVITSGEGGVFPAGIPVGTVVDIRHKDNGLATEARVKLSAKLGQLEEVWVLIP
jgi:rod shape-determining protein MreC